MAKFETEEQSIAEFQRIIALAKQMPEKITSREAAACAGVCIATFRNWEARGITPPRTEGYRRLYRKAEVLAFLANVNGDPFFRGSCRIYLPKRWAKMMNGLPPISGKTAGASTTQATSDQV